MPDCHWLMVSQSGLQLSLLIDIFTESNDWQLGDFIFLVKLQPSAEFGVGVILLSFEKLLVQLVDCADLRGLLIVLDLDSLMIEMVVVLLPMSLRVIVAGVDVVLDYVGHGICCRCDRPAGSRGLLI